MAEVEGVLIGWDEADGDRKSLAQSLRREAGDDWGRITTRSEGFFVPLDLAQRLGLADPDTDTEPDSTEPDTTEPDSGTEPNRTPEPDDRTGQPTEPDTEPNRTAEPDTGTEPDSGQPNRTPDTTEPDTEPDTVVGQYDPGQHTVPEVIRYLATLDADEVALVKAREAAGQDRKGIREHGG